MSIINTIGKNKEKKLSPSISKEAFIKKMIFIDDKEREDCERYLMLKGIAFHTIIANYIGLNDDGKIEYAKVSAMYRYDKRLRETLFNYISAFEEKVRAYICNKYINNIESLKKIKLIQKGLDNGNSLPTVLELLDFSGLEQVILKLSIKDKRILFISTKHLKENLDAIRELRNAVSHHRILFVYDFNDCYINDKCSNSLQDNIVNLYIYLDDFYKEHFKKRINTIIDDKNDSTFKRKIPKKSYLTIE